MVDRLGEEAAIVLEAERVELALDEAFSRALDRLRRIVDLERVVRR